MTTQTRTNKKNASRQPIPAGRTGKPVRATSRLRRVSLDCHGWVRDDSAKTGEHIWCTPCADWSRVVTVAE